MRKYILKTRVVPRKSVDFRPGCFFGKRPGLFVWTKAARQAVIFWKGWFLMPDWDPALYLKFKKERTQPALDLAARLELYPAAVLDVGCGPGNSTQVVAERFPRAKVTGVDSSASMVETARRAHPDLQFRLCDISQELESLPHDFDLVFSNACIQWVPDHPRLILGLLGLLKPGGVLAVQVPVNFKEPIHQIISRTVERTEWRERILYHRSFHTLTAEEYFDLLAAHAQDFTLWETTYLHRMPSHQAIMEWYSSTGLRPYLDAAVDRDAREGFYQEVFRQVREAYPVQENGEVIFRFPRLFFIAQA